MIIARSAVRLALSLAAATALAAAATGPALAANVAGSPIEIVSCSPVFASTAAQGYAPGLVLPQGIEVTYVNHAAVAVEDVAFQLGEGSSATTVVDHGSFAPGVAIAHVFWTGGAVVAGCRVSAARFADGDTFADAGLAAIEHR